MFFASRGFQIIKVWCDGLDLIENAQESGPVPGGELEAVLCVARKGGAPHLATASGVA
jgi:hypothetical protein